MRAKCKKTFNMEHQPGYATFTVGRVYCFKEGRAPIPDEPGPILSVMNDSGDEHFMDEAWVKEHFEEVV